MNVNRCEHFKSRLAIPPRNMKDPTYAVSVSDVLTLAVNRTCMVLLAGLLSSAAMLSAQPANDNFSNRVALTGARVNAIASNTGATRESGEPGEASFQHYTLEHTVWWSWTAPADGVMAASVVGSEFNAVFDIYAGEALQALRLTPLMDSAPSGSRCINARVAVSAGTTYHIVVGSEDGSAGEIVLNVAFVGRPANDNFSGRLVLAGDYDTAYGTNTAATLEEAEPAPVASSIRRTLWWSWTALSQGTVTMTVESAPPNPDDALFTSAPWFSGSLSVFTGNTLGMLAAVTNQSEYCDSRDWTMSQVTFEAVVGRVYQISVDGDWGGVHGFQLKVRRTVPPVVLLSSPANEAEFVAGDSVAGTAEAFDPEGKVSEVQFRLRNRFGDYESTITTGAERYTILWKDLGPGSYEIYARATDDLGAKSDAIPVNFEVRPLNDAFARRLSFAGSFTTVTGVLANASSEPGEPAGIGRATVWWAWTAPATGVFTITDTSAPGYPSKLSVFTGNSIGDMTLVASNTQGGADGSYSARVMFNAQAGMSYAIAVGTDGYGAWYTLSVAQTVPPTVTIVTPTNNSSFVVGDVVTFEANAQDSDGTVQKVDFVLDDYLPLGTVTNRPFTVACAFTNGGFMHRVRALATDNSGVLAQSDHVWFSVRYPGPRNDNFADRIPFTGSFVTLIGSSQYATLEPGEPNYVSAGSVWLAWTAPESGDFTISATSEYGYWPAMAVFTGSTLATLDLVTNATYSGENPEYSVSVVLHGQAGEVYPIAVGSQGDISLRVAKSLPPSVKMTSPTNNASFVLGETITFEAEANDPDGSVSRVEFYSPNDARLLGISTNRPFRLCLNTTNLFTGYGHVQALATDDYGLTSASPSVGFLVRQPGPINDDFANRIAFTGAFVSVKGSTAYATLEPEEAYYVSAGSAWWAWTAPESGDFTISATSKPGYWPAMAVFTGSALATLTLVINAAFYGENPTYSTRVVLHADVGKVYSIAVGSGADITLSVAKSLPPSVILTSPTNYASFVLGERITLEADATDPDGNVSRVEFRHSNGARSLGIATNRPFILRLSSTNFSMGYNQVQALATDDYGLTSASAEINFVVNHPPAPNDNFADRIALSGLFLVVPVQTINATFEAGESNPTSIYDAGSAWWSWTAPASGRVTLSCSCSSAFLGVYTGSNLMSLTSIATNIGSGDSVQLAFQALAGTEYQIALVSSRGFAHPSLLSLFLDARELGTPIMLSNGAFRFRLLSPPGRTWIMEAAENLTHWTPVATGYCADGVLEFLDPNAVFYPSRFYRAVVAPTPP